MLHRIWREFSLRNKILLMLLGTVLFSLIIALLSIHFISKAYNKTLYVTFSDSLSHSSSELSARLEDVEVISDLILANQTIQQELAFLRDIHFQSDLEFHKNNIYYALNDYPMNFPNSRIRYLALLQGTQFITTSPYDTAHLTQEILDTLTQKAMEGNAKSVWYTDYSEDYGLFLVRNLRESANLSLRSLGILIINVDLEALMEQSARTGSYEKTSYLILDGDSCFYHSPSLSDSEATALSSRLPETYDIVSVNGNDFFLSGIAGRHTDWTFLCALPYSTITGAIAATKILCIAAMVSGMLILFLLTGRLTASITDQFRLLIDKMRRMGKGEYHSDQSSSAQSLPMDELMLLNASFDSMATKIDSLIQENYVNELLKKEAQIRALENQMNPHFLYNTLDAINWRAKAAGETEISQIVLSLGNLMRAALTHQEGPHTLGDELLILDNYILIQEKRYKNRLDYTCIVPDSLKDCQIPKFILQPLVENAIRYGLEAVAEPCHICLSACQQDHFLIIDVCNSGSSFPERLLERLEEKEILPNGFGVGLLNIQQRIRLASGAAYGLNLYNREEDDGEEYATARILLPVQKGV